MCEWRLLTGYYPSDDEDMSCSWGDGASGILDSIYSANQHSPPVIRMVPRSVA